MSGRKRLIPAGAGQIIGWVGASGATWAHPRRCGADEPAPSEFRAAGGSSPQVRGRFEITTCPLLLIGLIPAGAGQIFAGVDGFGDSGAHPRRCGADSFLRLLFRLWLGSSPQVRGRFGFSSCWLDLCGLIPAGAGQIQQADQQKHGTGAHPRRCGADGIDRAVDDCFDGSSPQVRGRLCNHSREPFAVGLIPAGAGQMPTSKTSFTATRAHPRRCGADDSRCKLDFVRRGSSPQVRGRFSIVFLSF